MKVTTNTRPKASWISQFEHAYDEGRFHDAFVMFDDHAGEKEPANVLLRAARARMHSDPPQALKLLLSLTSQRLRAETQVERDALLTEAFARTNDFKSADQRLESALTRARQLRDQELLSQVGYRGVRRHLLAEEPAAARRYLKLTWSGRSAQARTYAAYAETIILPYEERVYEQAERLNELLQSLDPQSTAFIEIRAWSTHALAALARELYIPWAVP